MPGNVILFFLFRLSLDVDKAEKDNRDKETKILNLTRELDDMRDMYDKQKYSTTTLQREQKFTLRGILGDGAANYILHICLLHKRFKS
jgi:hypothetical protein